ncbi:MAG: hypothetical protein LBE09_09550 [Christensenellaceae bacterium]|jgi:hypothetical protein|nr:hypothetical protein [Christensenellaceae bacterium]
MKNLLKPAILFVAIILTIFYLGALGGEQNATIANADQTLPVAVVQYIEYSSASYAFEGHTYYSYAIVSLSGITEDFPDAWYEYRFGYEEPNLWHALPVNTNSFKIDYNVSGSMLSFKTKTATAESDTSTLSEAFYIAVTPELSDITLDIQNNKYAISFKIENVLTGLDSITVLTPSKEVIALDTTLRSFDITEHGSGDYWFIVKNMSQSISYSHFYADIVMPTFNVQALKGADLPTQTPVWADSASFLFMPDAIPLSGYSYYYHLKTAKDPDFGEWTQIPELNTFTFAPSQNGMIEFKAVSGTLIEYICPTIFQTYVDTITPEFTITGIPTAWTNEPVSLTIEITKQGHSGTKIYYLANDAVIPTAWNDQQLKETGKYKFYAVSGAQIQSAIEIVDLSWLDMTPPVIRGVTNNAVYTADVKISVTNFISKNSTIKKDGVHLDYSFDEEHGSITLTESGTYVVTVFDEAGNLAAVTFTINKPNIVLFITLTMLALVVIIVLTLLIISYQKNKLALKRLTTKTESESDSNYNYLLYKRIRSGRIGSSTNEYSIKPDKALPETNSKAVTHSETNPTTNSNEKDGIK